MKLFRNPMLLVPACLFCLWAFQAEASIAIPIPIPIPGLYSTGFDANGALLTNGAQDAHYTLTADPTGAVTAPVYQVANGSFPIGPWVGNSTTSQWIAPAFIPNGGVSNLVGNYTYETTFNLNGLNPASASITGIWSTDNRGLNVIINGSATGFTTTGDFSSLNTLFTINSGFVSGLNKLVFVVNNADGTNGNPTGLRVELSGTASPVPISPSALLFLPGLAGLMIIRKRVQN